MTPSKANQTALRNRLVELTGLSSRDANKLLENHRWDINEAVELHLDSQVSRKKLPDDSTVKLLEDVFLQFKEDDDTIGIEGTLKYIETLGYLPEDVVLLALAQFLESPSTGIFTKKLFISNWANEGISTIEGMQQKLQEFNELLHTNEEFLLNVYNFTFKYVLDGGQRSLNPDIAVDYWRLLLSNFDESKVNSWCKFITEKHNYAISKDQWQMTYQFFIWWRSHDLSEYDEALAWPSLMDTFVEDQSSI